MNCPECGTPFNVDEHCPYCYGIWLNKEKNRSKRNIYCITYLERGKEIGVIKVIPSREWYCVTKIVLTYCEKKLF